jgi:lipoprotein-anchoring transpeptidase ErfK/SrfK
MKVEAKTRLILPIVACVLLLAFSVTSAAAIVGDYAAMPVVTKGVTLKGHDLSGMTAAQVRTAIDQYVSAPAMQPLTVLGGSRSWTLDPSSIVSVDVDAMLQQVYAPARNATLFTRLYSRIAGAPLPADVTPVYSVATSTLQTWVQQTAATVDARAVNASRTVVGYGLKITPAVYGATVDQTKAVDVLSQALTADASSSDAGRVASLPISVVAPKVLDSSFKTAIVVSLSQCKVRLYNGAKLVKTYSCAPGQPAWPTPRGDFVIVRKQANAPWINPHSAWSASMPDRIAGGPGNPMGDRKIGINYPGVFLHGIPPSEYGSIGTHASHGCMRMMPSAIHDLYPRVKVGNPVYIRS